MEHVAHLHIDLFLVPFDPIQDQSSLLTQYVLSSGTIPGDGDVIPFHGTLIAMPWAWEMGRCEQPAPPR